MVQAWAARSLNTLVYDQDGQSAGRLARRLLLPTATDFPVVRAFASGNHPRPNNPLGVKGAGEGGLIATAGVVGNARGCRASQHSERRPFIALFAQNVWRMIHAPEQDDADGRVADKVGVPSHSR